MRIACYGLSCAAVLTALAFTSAASAQSRSPTDGNGNLDSLIAKHSAAYGVPEALIRRVIKRESRGNPRAISKGNYGLMQIRLGTARSMGYSGGIAGLLDADTNMTYAVKYLAGAYKVAGGNHDRAVQHYAAGYYYAAKRKGMTGILAQQAAAPVAKPVVKPLAAPVEVVDSTDSDPTDAPGKMSPDDQIALADSPDPRGAPGL